MGRSSDTKARLLQTVTDLVWKHSYGAVTVDAICESAAVQKGSFYHFFDSKTELAMTAFDELWVNFKAQLDQVFAPTTPPLERIRNYFQFHYETQLRLKEKYGRVLGCPFGCMGGELVMQNEAVSARVREILAYSPKCLETALLDAQTANLVKMDDIHARAASLFSFLEGTLLQARIFNDIELLRRMPEQAMRLIAQ